jgi:trigger factor
VTVTPSDTAAADGTQLSVAVERRPNSQVELRIEAPATEVDAAVDHALRHLASRVRLPGFRPGKAPSHIVERAVGWPAVVREVIDEAVPSLYARALQQAGVEVVSDPERLDVGDLERGRPLTVTALVTVKPEVDLGDYTSLRVDEVHTEIGDTDVDEAVEGVRRAHAELVDVDRPVQAGDVARASLVMKRGDEVVGGEGEERDIEVDRERLLPGLADGILGLSAGEQHTLELTLPEDYGREELRGVTVSVDVSIAGVRERKLPPLDDSLAALDTHGETLEELRRYYLDQLTTYTERNDRERYEGQVLEALRDRATVEVPEVMVEREIDRQLRDMELRLAGSGLRLDKYLEYTGETMEQVREARRPAAQLRVRLELVLEALAAAEGIEIDESDVEREETAVIGERKLTPEQRRRVHTATHRDLLLRAAAQRAMQIARGEG